MYDPPGMQGWMQPLYWSPGEKSKLADPMHMSPTHPTTGALAKRQAVEKGMMPEVCTEHQRRAQSYLRQTPLNVLPVTLSIAVVLGYRPNVQMHHESRCEIA